MNNILEKNFLALSAANKELSLRLSSSEASKHYTFLKSRTGETVPGFSPPHGDVQPLHSLVDPKREAQRVISTVHRDAGFLIILGLGGGFVPLAALELTDAKVVVIEYCIDSIVELFSCIDYSKLLSDVRFTLLIDIQGDELKRFILENYRPALCGGIKTLPLRVRTEQEQPKFEKAASAIREAIDAVSSDYSVQAHFGMRMFSNIIRNINAAANSPEKPFANKKVRETLIAAAGPSLDRQIPLIADLKSKGAFLIGCDTALSSLLNNGLVPDAVVSIDCQHISYYHFLGRDLRNIPIVLDIASPPMLSRLCDDTVFFAGGHPLAFYISAHWRRFLHLDTSGGNVTYACLSLAENLGAEHITLFGADFSYIRCQTYARGSYIYPFFDKKQNRLAPLEAQISKFLYRSPFIKDENGGKKNYYETTSLRFYRKKLEEKAAMMTANISCAQGLGAPVNLHKAPHTESALNNSKVFFGFPEKSENTKGTDFLEQYREDIATLPAVTENYMEKLSVNERVIFTTLLPYAAAVKKRNPELNNKDLIEDVKRRSIKEIEQVLNAESMS